MPGTVEQSHSAGRRRWFARRPPGLALTIAGRALFFASPSDFEFALRARTDVPGARLAELSRMALADIKIEADAVKRTETHILSLIEQLLDQKLDTSDALRRLGLQVFSHDHDWRSIVEQVQSGGAEREPWRRLVLIKYLQYLGARQEVLRTYHWLKTKREEADREAPDGVADNIETDMFEAGVLLPAGEGYTRLARAEPTLVRLPREQPLKLRLGRLEVEIAVDPAAELRIPGRDPIPLKRGINIVGRSRHVDICLDGAVPTVSRRHLVIDLMAHQQALLTDLSSRGTYVPGSALPD